MENKEMTLIVKILGLVGAIFCGICLILPWAGISLLGSGMSLYPWGASAFSTIASEWDFFFINSISTGVTENIVLSVIMIVAFIITIIALIIGILGVIKIGKKPSNSMLTAGILSIIAVILCVIAISQANALINQTGFGIALGFGAGFFLIIIAMILYFVTFALQKIFITSPMPGAYQQPMYQQPQYGQPQMTYTQQPPAQQMPPPQAPPVQQAPPPQQQPQTPPPAKTDQTFCPDCGTKLLPNSKFCPSCGKPI
ncbi:MAG: zinc ribbon domain-containing protein [Thermoplasmatales archaeon]|nr:zinc ribbon domain-containing protein [Thermoplasmatales archaeon]